MARRRRRRPASRDPSELDLLDARPSAVLDLHGFRGEEVRSAVSNFVTSWQRRIPGGVIHIVTGRGRSSAGRPVLAPAVRRCLRDDLAALVTEWCPDVAGGGFLVRLR
jgi:DNA-nicking Smr family endonuclease